MSEFTGHRAASRALWTTAVVALAICAASAPAGSPAWAQDAPTSVDLRTPVTWMVGEWVTETESLETTVTTTVVEGAAPARELPAEKTSLETTVVRKCTALGADRKPSKMILFVKFWRAAGGGAEDRSLEGAVLELRRDGWTLAKRAAEPTPRALAWLAGDVVAPVASGESAAADLLPARLTAVGDTWKPASADVAARLRRRLGVEADAQGLDVTCTLKSAAKSAEGVTVRIEHAGASAAKRDGSGVRVVQISGSLEGIPGAWHRSVTATASAVFERTTSAGAAKTTASTSVRHTAKCQPGGEIPAGTPALWLTESGIAKAAAGDAAGAASDFDAAIELDPLFANAWHQRAVLRAAENDPAAAIEDFTRAIEIDPRLAAAWSGRAAAHWASNQVDDAIQDWTAAIKLAPEDAKILYRRGVALAWQDQFDPAIEDFTRAVEIDPAYAAAFNNRGIAKDAKGDIPGALADYAKAAAADPTFVAAWFNMGRGKAATGDFEGAFADCTKAIEVDPKYAAAWNTRGNSRRELGDLDGAVADWTKTLEIDPRHGQAHFSIARTRFLPGLPAAPVVESLRKSIELSREIDFQHLWLWLARSRAGEEAEATKELNEYVARRKSTGPGEWYLVLAGLLTGAVIDDNALGESLTSDPKTSAQQLCEAAFYAGMLRILRGDVAKAVELFDRAIATNVTTYIEYREAHRWRPTILLGATTYVVREGGPAGGPKPGSLTIVSPDPKGAAALAGLLHGDVVTKMDGAALKPGQLEKFLMKAAAGTKVRLEVQRKSKKIHADVVLGAVKKG